MGFYIRKSLSAGPFRFNLSKSGVGVSVGIPGFRVGTGPRGNYVHMGRGGVYYRATLGGRPKPSGGHPSQPYPSPSSFRPSDVVMEDVTGSTALELIPTGGGDVVDQLNTAAARITWGWWATGAAILLGLLTLPYGLIIWTVLAPVCIWLVLNDHQRRQRGTAATERHTGTPRPPCPGPLYVVNGMVGEAAGFAAPHL